MENLKALTEAVCCVAREAGHFLKEERKSFRREVVQEKHAHDYVSYVDKASEKKVVSALRKLLPEAGFIAEEGSAAYSDETYCWVVDPLDGTTNYIHDNAPYCVSIALRDKQSLLLGVVYEPCRVLRKQISLPMKQLYWLAELRLLRLQRLRIISLWLH